jgi:uncharacterized OsmC-like protein
MGMTVTLDRMIHTSAVHHGFGKEIGLGGCCKEKDLNPIDLLAMSVASCMLIVMAQGAEEKGVDLTGAWADTSYELKDYVIASITVALHAPYSPCEAERAFLEKEGHRCPVYLAVKDNVDVKVTFEWGTAAAPAAKKAEKSCSRCG